MLQFNCMDTTKGIYDIPAKYCKNLINIQGEFCNWAWIAKSETMINTEEADFDEN